MNQRFTPTNSTDSSNGTDTFEVRLTAYGKALNDGKFIIAMENPFSINGDERGLTFEYDSEAEFQFIKKHLGILRGYNSLIKKHATFDEALNYQADLPGGKVTIDEFAHPITGVELLKGEYGIIAKDLFIKVDHSKLMTKYSRLNVVTYRKKEDFLTALELKQLDLGHKGFSPAQDLDGAYEQLLYLSKF